MNHFDSARRRNRSLSIPAAEFARCENQYGTKPFTGSKETVPHGFPQPVRTIGVELCYGIKSRINFVP
jgi:hypothetical protein